jgi:hypothetical protein
MQPSKVTGMYSLKRAFGINRSTRPNTSYPLGSVVPIQAIRSTVQVTPHFGEEANPDWQPWSAMYLAPSFHLNKFADKELHYMFT